MSRRIEIELTSARPDGTWTWRAAGAQKPKGVVDGSLLPAGATAGMVLRAEAETELEGTTILSVAAGKEKSTKSGLLELIASDKPFEAVTQQLARRERGDRGDRGDRRDRGDRPRGPRPDGDRPRGPRPEGADRPPRGPRPEGADRPPRGPRPEGADRPPRGPRPEGADRPPRGPRPDRGDRKPRFAAPPELPQRPKAKRLKPHRTHRNAVLADLPEAQKAVAERALQGGIPAVRQAVNEQNQRLRAEGREEIPAAGLLAIAEQLLPKLRVAEWLDRADAAVADLEELDLRDLRSVVAAAEDPMVARDETTREITAKLKEALVTKQEKELNLWFGDIDAAIGVGRVVRALKLSSQPPKAGVRFPTELATKLSAAATANLTPDALPDRWVAVLEAVAFSPVRAQVTAAAVPTQSSDELTATVKRLATLLPQIATLFGVEVDPKASPAKPLRPTAPAKKAPARPAKAAPPKPAAPKDTAPKDTAPKDTAPKDTAPKDAAPKDAAVVAAAPVAEEATAASDATAVETPAPEVTEEAPAAAEETTPAAVEEPAPVADEPVAAVVDEPVAAVEETPSAVAEEPVAAVEETPAAVADEPVAAAVDEVAAPVVEDAATAAETPAD